MQLGLLVLVVWVRLQQVHRLALEPSPVVCVGSVVWRVARLRRFPLSER